MAPDVGALRSRVNELEEEREELLCKLEQYDELRAKNGKKQKEIENLLHRDVLHLITELPNY